MKRAVIICCFLLQLVLFTNMNALAQCSLCTKTAQQMGEKPAQGLNSGILYLMGMPFMIVGYIGFRWWKSNKAFEEDEQKAA